MKGYILICFSLLVSFLLIACTPTTGSRPALGGEQRMTEAPSSPGDMQDVNMMRGANMVAPTRP